MVKMMKELGFRVIIASSDKIMSNIEKFSHVTNSCSVMVGAHGAGLANELFLPDGAVMIQVRPLGFQYGVDAFYSEPGPVDIVVSAAGRQILLDSKPPSTVVTNSTVVKKDAAVITSQVKKLQVQSSSTVLNKDHNHNHNDQSTEYLLTRLLGG
ncbi:hypothetical protein QVD17_27159 [Tagetes erecta]|uniref:Glycosyltransferase n=1 Tax=Tagetes erecta TaxID=13708 RepID=A0AAD8NRE1_TARER|nr:hypothetical protein QVD17_27159 [Tagetes erecta]